jgi:hypothetical protein
MLRHSINMLGFVCSFALSVFGWYISDFHDLAIPWVTFLVAFGHGRKEGKLFVYYLQILTFVLVMFKWCSKELVYLMTH